MEFMPQFKPRKAIEIVYYSWKVHSWRVTVLIEFLKKFILILAAIKKRLPLGEINDEVKKNHDQTNCNEVSLLKTLRN